MATGKIGQRLVRIGGKEFPIIAGPNHVVEYVHSGLATEAMLNSQLRAVYCAGANPVINVANSKRIYEALKKLDLLVSVDFFMTPTAELADYVLPPTTWLERDEISDGMNCACFK